MEGAALRPEYLADWETDDLAVVCLHVEHDALNERIRSESAYSMRSDDVKLAINKFAERSLRENAALVAAAERHGVTLVDVTDFKDAERLIDGLTIRLGN